MPSQDEADYQPAPPVGIRVRVALNPRSQPFMESLESLSQAIKVANQAGFLVSMETIRKGVQGFQNAGPVFAHFLQSDHTHLFLAADDIIYPPDVLVRLVTDDKDVVSGIYRKATLMLVEPANRVESNDQFLDYYQSAGVYETDYAAHHTMTIKRHVIEKMVKDYPELEWNDPRTGETCYGLFLPMIKDRIAFQDDWAFSIRARQSGFKLWNDFGVRLKHFCGDFVDMAAVLRPIDFRRANGEAAHAG